MGQHGFIYLDRETNQILRIVAAADPPEKFPGPAVDVGFGLRFPDGRDRTSSCFRCAPTSE